MMVEEQQREVGGCDSMYLSDAALTQKVTDSLIAHDFCDVLIFIRQLITSNIELTKALIESPDDEDFILALVGVDLALPEVWSHPYPYFCTQAENKDIIRRKKNELQEIRLTLESLCPGVSKVLVSRMKSGEAYVASHTSATHEEQDEYNVTLLEDSVAEEKATDAHMEHETTGGVFLWPEGRKGCMGSH